VRNQIRQIRSRDLRQYLVAKKVSIKGCVGMSFNIVIALTYDCNKIFNKY